MINKISYEIMVEQLKTMPKAEIERHLKTLGCPVSYDEIAKRLANTYNDLEVSDVLFTCYKIDDENSPYQMDFIDEAILEIAKREDFGFEHYGILADSLTEAQELSDVEAKINESEALFRKLFKLAQKFKQPSLERMIYTVNDGVDMFALIVDMLDDMQVLARNDKAYANRIIKFVDKFLQVFTKTSPFMKVTLAYEQAQAYMVMKSKKGEQIFLNLLKTHQDTTDVVLHYGLAYIDDEPKKTLKIFDRYQKQLNKESEAYTTIQEIISDLKEN